MPIEFRCTQCGQSLRVPDESAGKQARCPKCSSLMTIPAASSLAQPFSPPPAPGPSFSAPPPSPYSPSPYPPPPKPADSPFSGASPPAPSLPSPNPYSSSPYAPSYAQSGPSQTPMMLAVGSLATAVAGLLSCACCLFMPFPPISLVLGIIALNQQPNPQARTIAITGIALSLLSLILFAVGMIVGLAGMALDPQFQQGLGK